MFLFQGWFTPLGLTCLYLREFLFYVGKIVSFTLITGISKDFLLKYRVHLIDKGKDFLAENFIVYLKNISLETHTHYPP